MQSGIGLNRGGMPRWTLLTVLLLLLAACGGSEGETAGGGAAATPAGTEAAAGGAGTAAATEAEATSEATGAEATGSEASGGQAQVDLSGVSLTASTSKPGALGIPQFYAFDLLREWGAQLEVVTLTTTPGVQALVAGRTQLAPHGADELILGAAEGATPVAVGASEAKQGYVLVARGGISSLEQLQGKVIGMSGPAGFDALLSRFALEEVGLNPQSDVRFVQIGGSPDRAAALLAGNVDAATIFIDDWFELEKRTDDVQIIQRMAELVPDYPATVYFSLAPYWEENPQVALGVACANLEANKWAQENKQEFIDFGIELVEGASAEAVEDLYDFAIDVGMYPTDPQEVLSTRGMEGLMEGMLETGDISEPVDVEQVVDTSYLEEAANMGCGQ